MNHLPSELLDQYFDDELRPSDRAVVEAHLATCPACRQELAASRDLARRLAGLPAEPLPLDLAPLVMHRIAAPAARTSRFGAALLAGQLAAVATLAFWLMAQPSASDVFALDSSWLPLPFEAALSWLGLIQDGLAAISSSAGLSPLTPAEPITTIGAPALLVALAVWLIGNGLLLARDPAAERGRGAA